MIVLGAALSDRAITIVDVIITILISLLGIAMIIVNILFSCLLLYKSWQAIQGGQTRITPEKALGFIFIPVYNFYWYFIAYWAFARNYNLYLQQKSIDPPQLPEKLFLSYPILLLCALIPYAGFAIGIAAVVIFFIISNKSIDAINNLYIADNVTD